MNEGTGPDGREGATPGERPPADAPPTAQPPQPEPTASPSTPIVSWAPPPPRTETAGAVSVGRLVNATLDTYIAGWRLFIALGVPAAIGGGLFAGAAVGEIRRGTIGPSVGLFVVAAIASVVVTLAMVVVADDLLVGRRPQLGGALRRAAVRFLPLVVTYLALAVIFIGLSLVAVLSFGIATSLGSGAVLIAVIVLIVVVVAFVVLTVRLALIVPIVLVERLGPLATLNRSWELTRGKALTVFGLVFVVGLLAFPLSIGASMLVRPEWGLLAAIPVGLAAVVTTPLGQIAPLVAYRALLARLGQAPPADIVPGEDAPPAVRPSPAGRNALLGLLIGGGVLAIAIGAATGGTYGGGFDAAVPQDPGQILTGRAANPLDPCRPTGITTSFSSSDSIYVGGYFTRAVSPNERATVSLYRDGELLGSEELSSSQDIRCYYEAEPVTGAPVGTYRFEVKTGSEVIAEGGFTVR